MKKPYISPKIEMEINLTTGACLLTGSGEWSTIGIGQGERSATESLAPGLLMGDDIPSF